MIAYVYMYILVMIILLIIILITILITILILIIIIIIIILIINSGNDNNLVRRRTEGPPCVLAIFSTACDFSSILFRHCFTTSDFMMPYM